MRTVTTMTAPGGDVTAYTEEREDGTRRVIRTGDGVFAGTAWPESSISTHDGITTVWHVEDIDGRVTTRAWLPSAVRHAVAVATGRPMLTVTSHGEATAIPTRVAAAFNRHREHAARVAALRTESDR